MPNTNRSSDVFYDQEDENRSLTDGESRKHCVRNLDPVMMASMAVIMLGIASRDGAGGRFGGVGRLYSICLLAIEWATSKDARVSSSPPAIAVLPSLSTVNAMISATRRS